MMVGPKDEIFLRPSDVLGVLFTPVNIRLFDVFNVRCLGERVLSWVVGFFRELVRSISVDWSWDEANFENWSKK